MKQSFCFSRYDAFVKNYVFMYYSVAKKQNKKGLLSMNNMKIQINFFNEKFIEAIGAGIYKISIRYNDKQEVLYIGESVFVLVRCAAHLYELRKNSDYLGFTETSIKNEKIVLDFELIEQSEKLSQRRKLEIKYIDLYKPIMQSGIKDRMKSIKGKKAALKSFSDDEE